MSEKQLEKSSSVFENLKRSKAIFENNLVSFFLLDREAKIQAFNRIADYRVAKSFKREIQAGDSIQNFIPSQDSDLFEQDFNKALQGQTVEHKGSWLNLEGKNLLVDFNFIPVIEQDGEVSGVCLNLTGITENIIGGFGRDITEGKKAQELLQTQALVLESMSEGVSIHDQNDQIVFTNPAFDSMFGYERGGLIGKHVTVLDAEIVHTTDETMKEILAQLKQRGFWRGEFRNIKKDGTIFTSYVRISELYTSGEVQRICVREDITELKQIENERQKNQKLYRTLAQNFPNGAVFLLDHDLRFLVVDGMGLAAAGLNKDELEGGILREVVSPALADFLEPKYRAALAGKSFVTELTYEGQTYQIHFLPVRNEQGEIFAGMAMSLDITKDRKMSEELLRASKLESLGLLAGGIAHDFNNALAAILGNISVVRMYSELPQEYASILEQAEMATLHARDLTRQLLTFAKGGVPIRKTAMLAEIIQDSIRAGLQNSLIECQFELAEGLWPVDVDIAQLNHAIQNLVVYVVEDMARRGELKVGAANVLLQNYEVPALAGGQYLRLLIETKRGGISPKHLPRIFDPYFTTGEFGYGLGLASAYSIVKKHDGHITVESEPGAGTTFVIYLPASVKAIRPPQPGKKAQTPSLLGKVLVMDDEAMVRSALTIVLKRLGYEVEASQDGAEALEKYQQATANQRPFNVVIMDLTVRGGMGGKEAIEKLLKIDSKARAIVSSGYSDDPVMANYQEYGFVGMVGKPYRVQELKQVLDEVMGMGDD